MTRTAPDGTFVRPPAFTERLTILNYTPESFEGPWLDHQRVMSRLARRHTVIYVRPDRTMDDLKGILRGSTRLGSMVRFLAPGIHELTPSVLVPRVYSFQALNRGIDWLRAEIVRRNAERLNGRARKVLYFWNPSFCGLVGRMKEDLSVFHIHDYYPAFAEKGTLEYSRIKDNLKKAIETTDLVIACSDTLLDEARAWPQGREACRKWR